MLALGSLATVVFGVVMAIVVSSEFADKLHASQPHRVLGHAVLAFSLFAAGKAGLIVAGFGCDKCLSRLTGKFWHDDDGGDRWRIQPRCNMKKLLVLGVLAHLAIGLACPEAGSAQGLGLDGAIAARKPSCIYNDLRIGCQADDKVVYAVSPFYVDWNAAARRCIVTTDKPVYHVIDGGPFETRAEARAAIKTIKGCP
ncbi:hypothetical protein [Bradyrhizobium sp.]|uniref:hypothetical protein n=1 Tax=Bradyrhizobium sp. TaxID=376 RepID=UPI003C77DE53